MVNHNPSPIQRLVARDVGIVTRNALAVISIDRSEHVSIHLHPGTPRLPVIAVVGPGKYRGRRYKQALLCEVGTCRTRPYAQSTPSLEICIPGEAREIPERRKLFSLSDKQYLAVAPHLFRMIVQLMGKKMAGRKKGTPDDPTYIRKVIPCFSKIRSEFACRKVLVPLVTGVRYSVSFADKRLLADILWAERNLNEETEKRAVGQARSILFLVSKFAQLQMKRERELNFWKSDFGTEFKLLMERVARLPHEKDRLLVELLRQYKKIKRSGSPRERFLVDRLIREVADKFGDPNKFFSQIAMMSLQKRARRFGRILLRSILSNHRYLVFEVMPRAKKHVQVEQPPCSDEDVPF